MTNDEFQMTNQIKNQKSEWNERRRYVRASNFGFLSAFVIRISSFVHCPSFIS